MAVWAVKEVRLLKLNANVRSRRIGAFAYTGRRFTDINVSRLFFFCHSLIGRFCIFGFIYFKGVWDYFRCSVFILFLRIDTQVYLCYIYYDRRSTTDVAK